MRQLPTVNNQTVKVYRNLSDNCLSVMQKGYIVGHAQQVLLENVVFQVNENGRQKVLARTRKNVHAFVKGTLTRAIAWAENPQELIDDGAIAISYNPYKHGYFYRKDNEQPVTEARIVAITTQGVFAWEVGK